MNIKNLRLVSFLSQKDFALKYKIPLKTLQNWEADKNTGSYRECPSYVLFLLEEAVKRDFPKSVQLLNKNIDENHLLCINQAKKKILKSPLYKFITDLILYGSTARGEAKKTSDIDILIVLDENVKEEKNYNNWIIYLKGNISSNDFNVPETDLHIVYDNNWKENHDAYFLNIKEEGISIWN